MASTRKGGGLTKEDDMATEKDYKAARDRGYDIEGEIDGEIEEEWKGEEPSSGEWRKQTEVTNKLLVRAIVLLEGIADHLQARWDER